MDFTGGKEIRSGGEVDDETLTRRRSRRVSFAETTAVHVFERDDESDTPPDSRSDASGGSSSGEGLGFPGDRSESDDEQMLFVRDMDSSSPGSTVGSVTSNDDDNFFGPVSESFISSGRLSEAAISEDNNHDLTLDSTAFSLHFRNIAPPDDRSVNSSGSTRTPIGQTPPVESMTSMGFKKLSDGTKSRSGGGSNSMSLIVENPHKYDYGKLSPTLEALLAEVNKGMQCVSPNNGKQVVGPTHLARGSADEKESGEFELDGRADGASDQVHHANLFRNMDAAPHMDENVDRETQRIGTPMVGDDLEVAQVDIVADNSYFSPLHRKSQRDSTLQSNDFHWSHRSQFPPKSVPLVSEAVMYMKQLPESESEIHTPKSTVQHFQPHCSLEMEVARSGDRISAFGNHISKFKILDTPISADSRLALSGKDLMLLEPEGTLDKKSSDDPNMRNMGFPLNDVEENNSGFETPNIRTYLENNMAGETVKSIGTSPGPRLFHSEVSKKRNPLTPLNLIIRAVTPNPHSYSKRQTIVESKKNTQDSGFTRSGGTFRARPLLEGKKSQSLTNFSTTLSNNDRNLQSPKGIFNNGNILHNSHEEMESSRDILLRGQDINIKIKKGLIYGRQEFSESEMFASGDKPVSGVPREKSALISKFKFLANIRPFPSIDTEPTNSTQDPKQYDYDVNLHDPLSVQESFSAQGVDVFGKKRKIDNILVSESDLFNEVGMTHKSPKLLSKDTSNLPGSSSGSHIGRSNEAVENGGKATLKHWTDIIHKVSEATKQLLCPSTYKLSLQEIDILEDLLGGLQTARKYERLLTSLEKDECLGDPHQKRVAEVRSLQDKLIFEQAKLHLKSAKLRLLHSKAKLSQSHIQECRKLKSIFARLGSYGAAASQTQDAHLLSYSTSRNRNQEEGSKASLMRHELEILDQKVEHLVKSFSASLNIEGNMDSDGIIKLVSEHIKTRNRSRAVRRSMHLWELSDIMRKNSESEIVLNYHNFLSQRFTINSGPVSKIVVSNFVNDANIEKNFPNMNTCIAFEFVFKAKDVRRLANAKCFPQETLVTNLLLGNLLDILQEVQTSQIKLWNLMSLGFDSQCSGKLELKLCFFNFKSGRKVTLALDMTNLGCAVYPSNPSQLQLRIISQNTTLPPSTTDEITGAVARLQTGRPMILRLCQKISQVVQTPSSG